MFPTIFPQESFKTNKSKTITNRRKIASGQEAVTNFPETKTVWSVVAGITQESEPSPPGRGQSHGKSGYNQLIEETADAEAEDSSGRGDWNGIP